MQKIIKNECNYIHNHELRIDTQTAADQQDNHNMLVNERSKLEPQLSPLTFKRNQNHSQQLTIRLKKIYDVKNKIKTKKNKQAQELKWNDIFGTYLQTDKLYQKQTTSISHVRSMKKSNKKNNEKPKQLVIFDNKQKSMNQKEQQEQMIKTCPFLNYDPLSSKMPITAVDKENQQELNSRTDSNQSTTAGNGYRAIKNDNGFLLHLDGFLQGKGDIIELINKRNFPKQKAQRETSEKVSARISENSIENPSLKGQISPFNFQNKANQDIKRKSCQIYPPNDTIMTERANKSKDNTTDKQCHNMQGQSQDGFHITEQTQRTLGRKQTWLLMNAVKKFEQRQQNGLRDNRIKTLFQTMRGFVQRRIEQQRTSSQSKLSNIKDLELFASFFNIGKDMYNKIENKDLLNVNSSKKYFQRESHQTRNLRQVSLRTCNRNLEKAPLYQEMLFKKQHMQILRNNLELSVGKFNDILRVSSEMERAMKLQRLAKSIERKDHYVVKTSYNPATEIMFSPAYKIDEALANKIPLANIVQHKKPNSKPTTTSSLMQTIRTTMHAPVIREFTTNHSETTRAERSSNPTLSDCNYFKRTRPLDNSKEEVKKNNHFRFKSLGGLSQSQSQSSSNFNINKNQYSRRQNYTDEMNNKRNKHIPRVQIPNFDLKFKRNYDRQKITNQDLELYCLLQQSSPLNPAKDLHMQDLLLEEAEFYKKIEIHDKLLSHPTPMSFQTVAKNEKDQQEYIVRKEKAEKMRNLRGHKQIQLNKVIKSHSNTNSNQFDSKDAKSQTQNDFYVIARNQPHSIYNNNSCSTKKKDKQQFDDDEFYNNRLSDDSSLISETEVKLDLLYKKSRQIQSRIISKNNDGFGARLKQFMKLRCLNKDVNDINQIKLLR